MRGTTLRISRAFHGRGPCRGHLRIAARKGGKDSGKLHAEHGATRLRVVTQNFSAVLLHDAEADAEPQASALPNRLGGIERIENAVRLRGAGGGIGKQKGEVGGGGPV